MASQSDTIESLVLAVAMNTQQVNKALKALERDTAQTANKITKNFDNVVPFERTQQSFARSSKAMANDAKVLGYQFNDLFSQISSGTSVTQALNQQLGQIGQVLGAAGGIKAGASLVGQALISMVPVVAISTAFAAITAAAASYFSSTEDDAEKTNKALEEHRKLIKSAADKWGDAIPYLKRYAAELDTIAEKQEKLDVKASLEKDAFKPTVEAVAAVKEQVKLLQKTMSVGNDEARADARKLAEDWKAFEKEIAAGRPGEEQFRTLVALLEEFKTKGVEGASAVSDAINTRIGVSLDTTHEKLKTIAKDFEQIDSRLESLGGLRDAARFAAVRARDEALGMSAADMDAATRLIKAEEGFRKKAYPDKNARTGKFDAWRVGFGSDTYVDDMNRVQKVTEQTVITFEQANADLHRRIGEFQATIQSQIGGDLWKSLEENQKAALTSLAYNYGSLPDSIVAAIQAGDRGKVAQAIAGLSANPDRRMREAELYAGHALTGKAAREATPYIDEEARATDAAAESAARLLQAQRALTPEQEALARSADQLSQQYANIAKGALTSFVSDLRRGVSAGEAFQNMLDRVIDSIINMAIEAMFAKSALGGVFGGILGGGGGATTSAATMHTGGKVGGSSRSMRSGISPATFAGAPRLHNGLMPSEFPAILQKGEIVIPKSMAKAAATNAGGGVVNNINVDVTTGAVTANNQDAKELGLRINRAVQAVLVSERRPGGLLRA